MIRQYRLVQLREPISKGGTLGSVFYNSAKVPKGFWVQKLSGMWEGQGHISTGPVLSLWHEVNSGSLNDKDMNH